MNTHARPASRSWKLTISNLNDHGGFGAVKFKSYSLLGVRVVFCLRRPGRAKRYRHDELAGYITDYDRKGAPVILNIGVSP